MDMLGATVAHINSSFLPFLSKSSLVPSIYSLIRLFIDSFAHSIYPTNKSMVKSLPKTLNLIPFVGGAEMTTQPRKKEDRR